MKVLLLSFQLEGTFRNFNQTQKLELPRTAE